MKMSEVFKRIFFGVVREIKKAPLEPKDPMDWTLTRNSREWETDQYCPNCLSTTCHKEMMADVCNSCGHHGDMMSYRSSRKIWNGEKWVTQRKYSNNNIVIED